MTAAVLIALRCMSFGTNREEEGSHSLTPWPKPPEFPPFSTALLETLTEVVVCLGLGHNLKIKHSWPIWLTASHRLT